MSLSIPGDRPAVTSAGAPNERVASAATLYTKSIDSSGWLRVKLEPAGANAYLCEFVKVQVLEEGPRTTFAIMEGEYKGRKASLARENAARCLVRATRGLGAALFVRTLGREPLVSRPRGGKALNQLLAKLKFDGKSATITLDSDIDYIETNQASPRRNMRLHSKELPKGSYRILAPQYPKKAAFTEFYVDAPGGYPGLKYHTVWFPIEYAATDNSNFVHVGNVSEGCVTVYELAMWNPLYAYLIKNRMDKEGKYVGTVTIS